MDEGKMKTLQVSEAIEVKVSRSTKHTSVKVECDICDQTF